jgi:hypothetical protein
VYQKRKTKIENTEKIHTEKEGIKIKKYKIVIIKDIHKKVK